MNLAAEEARVRHEPAVLTCGFRPFFLAAALWAAAAVAIWIVVLQTGLALPSRFDPLAWHIHEMLFGFVMAAVAGFLLTAIPNWTGRHAVSGASLGFLAGLWLVGRVACLISQMLPLWLVIASDLAFPVALLAIVAREIIAAKNRRNMPMIMPIAVLGIANLLMHLEAAGVAIPTGLGWRLGLAAVLALVSVIGGRIIPSFTRNWLAARQVKDLPAPHGPADRLALGSLHAGLFGWAFLPTASPVGVLLILGAIFNLWRLMRWQGTRTAAEPLLLILHVGYGWLCVGAVVLGLSILTSAVPASAGIHALTVGAIGTMILAVMTRVTRGHTGRQLTSDPATNVLYGCVIAAALTRIAAAFATVWSMPLLIASGCFWIAAFILFITRYSPMLLQPRDGH